jgi:hypothetical protein
MEARSRSCSIVHEVIHAQDAGMEVDTFFSPPDPSGEVPLPVLPNEPRGSSTRARAVVLVAGALIAVAGVFVLGRWTTGGERDALAGERDAARQERSALGERVNQLERDVESASAANSEHETAIDDLERAAADDAAELNRMRTMIAVAAQRNSDLEDSNNELWAHVSAVSDCGGAVNAAAAALEKWNAMLPLMDDYLRAAPGSDEEQTASEALDHAFADIDDAEKAYAASSALCTSAVEALPDCDGELKTMEVAVEAFKAQNGRGPDTEQDLVDAGFIRRPFDEFDLTNGDITPAAGSPCPTTSR